MPITGPIARNTIKTTVVLGVRLLVQAAVLLIVARMLGAGLFATFTAAASAALLLGALSTFGTHILLLAEHSRNESARAAALSFALSVTLISGTLLLALYLLVAVVFLRGLPISIEALIAIGLAELIFQPVLRLRSAVHQGRGRVATSQLIMVVPLILRLAAATTIWLSAATHPLRDYAYGYLAASLAAVLMTRSKNRSLHTGVASMRLPTVSELRHAGGYAAMSLTAEGPAELDKVLATQLLPLNVAGLYAAGARIIGALTLPVAALMLSAVPRLFHDGLDRRARSGHLLMWIFLSALTYSLMVAFLLWEAAPLLEQLFGLHYRNLASVLRWLTLAIPGMALRIAGGSALVALGKPWLRSAIEATGVAALIVVSVVLTRFLGGSGMALALSVGEWGMAIAGWLVIILLLGNGRHSRMPVQLG